MNIKIVKRLQYLDALRGLAVLMVLMVHSTELSDISKLPQTFIKFVSSGIYGVQLFFVISAFTIFYTLYNDKKTTTSFLIRRFFRIAPAYYLAILFYSFYNHNWGLGQLLNFTFLHGFSPLYINSIVPGGWSIGIEMVFYLLVPFLFKYINTLSKSLLFFLISLVIKTACFYLLKLDSLPSIYHDGSFIYFWLPNQLPVFAIGIILYFSISQPIEFKKVYVYLLILIGIVLVVLLTNFPLLNDHILISIAFAALIAVLSKAEQNKWLENKVLLLIGKISYSAYLCQYAIIFLLRYLNITNIFQDPYLNFLYNLSLLALLTFTLAFILFKSVEKPAQEFGKYFYKRLTRKN